MQSKEMLVVLPRSKQRSYFDISSIHELKINVFLKYSEKKLMIVLFCFHFS